MEDLQEDSSRSRQIATVGIGFFLLGWTFVEDLTGFKTNPSATPGTTSRAAIQHLP
jgi:hypothetical protein